MVIYINIDFLNKSLEEYALTDNTHPDENTQLFPYDDTSNKFVMYKKHDIDNHNALQEELKHFANCIKNSTSPIVNGNIAKEALDVALIIQEKINAR